MASIVAEKLLEAIRSGEVTDRDDLQRLKMKLCARYGSDKVPSNSEILALVTEEEKKAILPLLVKKPMRTASGVAVVAVMTSPYPCPHGKCAYCPGGVSNDSPQSYTGKEPAARRAAMNRFDPYDQVESRLTQLEEIGHDTDKIDLIIMGGTFTSRNPQYQEWFVKRCLEAMNGHPSPSLEAAQEENSHAKRRCIGLTVETRPDYFCKDIQIERMMMLGATRVELGVQILDDDILKGVERGHGVEEVIRATKVCRDHGLKVCYHLMPGLPGSDPDKDYESFRRCFEDPAFRPDMLKFYPTLVVAGTKLYDMWKEGEYNPYTVETATELLSRMKAIVPDYVRIQRIQRDIPVPEITAGILKSNLRQLVQKNMEDHGQRCRCIRCREVGHTGEILEDPSEVRMETVEYGAAGGTEHFISYTYHDSLVGYVRLRINDTDSAMIRELKVFGNETAIGAAAESWQHRGFGRKLVAEAERVASEKGKTRITVTSGIGVREYYASLGYHLERPYMAKDL
ncbi:MAG: tRNA uridine(34) 5-carboxymethylaminomethyl modification radical SAM/GNAT enzyme Elp3 [Candidatus Methanomethylophilus sp.]|nr:tRNA uridine(34) 5-carboxymethylaminomethyl modification radical SAM/GNAT enzyme Elp3 [Methanomethylophilus sp.]